MNAKLDAKLLHLSPNMDLVRGDASMGEMNGIFCTQVFIWLQNNQFCRENGYRNRETNIQHYVIKNKFEKSVLWEKTIYREIDLGTIILYLGGADAT